MRPPLCRQIKDNEKKIPGDVGAIRELNSTKSEEYHGFIYISDKIAYSKNGYLNSSPYSLQTLDNVLNVYGVPDRNECRKNELNYNANCGKSASYFRCISMDQYLKQNPNLPKQLITTLNTVRSLEDCVESRAISGKAFPTQAVDVVNDSTKAITFYLEQELKKDKSKNKEEEAKRNFLLGSLQLRLLAISDQLYNTKDNQLLNEVDNFSKEMLKSLIKLRDKK
jgi:hypothetical protein